MRKTIRTALTAGAAIAFLGMGAGAAQAQDADIAVADGGIKVSGWEGRIDASAAERGEVLENARLAEEEGNLRVTTGPAVSYWNPANTASGNYTVSATFTEPEYMALNDHPHPYGLFIGGSALGSDQQSYLYCAAYGSGNFIVRGFGPEPFQLNGRRGEAHDAVSRAPGQGQPVTQQIAISVKDDSVDCAINGTVVGSYPKADVLAEGRLSGTDGIYGVRFGHNTDAIVSGLQVTQD